MKLMELNNSAMTNNSIALNQETTAVDPAKDENADPERRKIVQIMKQKNRAKDILVRDMRSFLDEHGVETRDLKKMSSLI